MVHSSRPADYQTLAGRSTSYEVSAVTSSPRPKECEISSYRHGCDPPKKIHVLPPSDRKDYLTTRASQQSLIRLIELQPSLLALASFDFTKTKHVSFERLHLSKIGENFGKDCERLTPPALPLIDRLLKKRWCL